MVYLVTVSVASIGCGYPDENKRRGKLMKHAKLMGLAAILSAMLLVGNAYALGNIVVETGAGELIKTIDKNSDHGKKIGKALQEFNSKMNDKSRDFEKDTLVFFENNKCDGNVKGTLPFDHYRDIKAGNTSWFANDEVRSVLIRSKALHPDVWPAVEGSVLVLYDNPSGNMKNRINDPYVVIRFKQDLTNANKDVCITTFEDTSAQLTDTGKEVSIEVSYVQPGNKGKLDGKVSTIVASPGKAAANYHEQEWRKAFPPDIVFYEGNNCNQSIKGMFTSTGDYSVNCKDAKDCDNDEIRSMRLFRWANQHYRTDIKVYDNPDGKTDKKAWASVKIDKMLKNGVPVWGFSGSSQCIGSFEEDKTLGGGSIGVTWHYKKNIDGKISRVTISH